MKNIKKIICSILCFALLLGTVAFADEVIPTADGDVTPTEENPTDVGTVEPAPIVSDEIKVSVNGQIVVFDDVKPQILDGRTLVPFRKVGEAMNAAVAWRGTDRTAHYFRNGISVMLTIGKSEMEVREYEMGEKFVYTTEAQVSPIDPEQPSVIARTIDDRTMIPIRATAEALGAKVDWDDATRTVIITIPTYSLKLADKDAAALIADWNYKPATEIKGGKVNVSLKNAAGVDSASIDGINVTVGEKEDKTANDGTATLRGIPIGNYEISFTDVPDGYVIVGDTKVDIVKNGEEKNVSLTLAIASANVEFTVTANYEGGRAEDVKGVSIKFNNETKTIDESGKCTFENVKLGEYKAEISDVPEGLTISG